MINKFDLERFLFAQNANLSYHHACKELLNGTKESHWMWFVFPQIQGLGKSEMSKVYGIVSIEEATQYISHPILGPRIEYVTGIVLENSRKSIKEIFGVLDASKFRSSMTLFDVAKPQDIFAEVIRVRCSGRRCLETPFILSKEISKTISK